MSETSIAVTADDASRGRTPVAVAWPESPCLEHRAGNDAARGLRQDAARLRDALHGIHVVVIVPAYNEARNIESTLTAIPDFVRTIIVVDDGSSDDTAAIVDRRASSDDRVLLLRQKTNRGLGHAMVLGYRAALQRDADIVVKMDGDGQMSPKDLPDLLEPLLRGHADYSKGNRFHDFEALRRMPAIRRLGNVVLSFLTKAAVGYWHLFDPCNGYVAIRGSVLRKLDLNAVARSFFFETSMLANLNLLGAVVRDVSLPARYGDERSHLAIHQVVWEFPRRLLVCFLRRLVLKNFLYDFSMESVYLLTGLPLFLCGLLYGAANWYAYWRAGEGAPTGTVVIPAMMIILGFQLLLAAINEDLRRIPRVPLDGRPLQPDAPAFPSPTSTFHSRGSGTPMEPLAQPPL